MFGREEPEEPDELVRLAKLTRKLASSEDEKLRAIGLNLLYDHRISRGRALRFVDFLGSRLDDSEAEKLVQGLADYHRQWIARFPRHTFEDSEHNADNCVYDEDLEVGLPGDYELVHVCNITKRLLRITNPDVKRRVPRLALPTFAGPASVEVFLRRRLADEGKRPEFVDDFLTLLEINRQMNPWHPVWVASWKDFERTVDPESPQTWLEAVGRQSPPEPNWIMVLRYKASDVKAKIYRPTQLEAGAFPWHFPSPKTDLPPLRGGHPMNLGEGRRLTPAGLVSEFVHSEIRLTPEYWRLGGALLAPTQVPTGGYLMGYRRMHYLALCEDYGRRSVQRWMPDPVKLKT